MQRQNSEAKEEEGKRAKRVQTKDNRPVGQGRIQKKAQVIVVVMRKQPNIWDTCLQYQVNCLR